ncbi:ribokinase [Roseomonas sp. AR75]|uniref:ribokinase n=1 Tax=Roseomonas sp. AR75 TaxID=2562311 RepID=UPI0010BF6E47|nr:ribokinase [Roseomonas sp. AR75]
MTVLVFGSANADLVFAVPQLPAPGATVLGEGVRSFPGGKGANQAVAAARDGAAVQFAGCVGRDAFAEVATAALREAGVDLSRLAVVDQPTGCAAICVDPAGRNQIAVAPGANETARAAQVENAALHPDVVVLLQMEVPAAEVAALIHRAKARGARVVLNLAPPGALPLDALRALDVLVVNEHEAEVLLHRLRAPDHGLLAAALGTALLVTLGERGAAFFHGTTTFGVPAFPVTPVDTTGAGDCFCGVLCAGLDRGLTMQQAMRRASAAASLACTRPGAASAMPTASETDALLG